MAKESTLSDKANTQGVTEADQELVTQASHHWFFGLVVTAGLFCLAVILFIL